MGQHEEEIIFLLFKFFLLHRQSPVVKRTLNPPKDVIG